RRTGRRRRRLLLPLELVHLVVLGRRRWIAARLRGRAGAPTRAVGERQAQRDRALPRLVERVAPGGLAALHLEHALLDEQRHDRAGLALPLEAAPADRGPLRSGGEGDGHHVRREAGRVVHGERRSVLDRVTPGAERGRRDLVGRRVALGRRLERDFPLVGIGGGGRRVALCGGGLISSRRAPGARPA